MNKQLLSGIAATTFVASLAFAAPASAAVTSAVLRQRRITHP